MDRRELRVAIVMGMLFIVIILVAFFIQNNKSSDIKLSEVKIKNKNILLISKKEKDASIEGLIEYLNKQHYYDCSEIEFYNNTFDRESNKKYFYALVKGGDKSLIEITNLGHLRFKYSYIGNENTVEYKSKKTGVSYIQIVSPEDYEMYQKIDEGLNSGNDTEDKPVVW